MVGPYDLLPNRERLFVNLLKKRSIQLSVSNMLLLFYSCLQCRLLIWYNRVEVIQMVVRKLVGSERAGHLVIET
jgi:hypothetical protein